MFCKQKIFCIRRDVLYTSKISKILVILTPKPLGNEGFSYVKYVRTWKAVFSVVVNIVNSALGVPWSQPFLCLTSCPFHFCTGNCWLSEPRLRLTAAVVVTLVVALSVSLAIACGTRVCDNSCFHSSSKSGCQSWKQLG